MIRNSLAPRSTAWFAIGFVALCVAAIPAGCHPAPAATLAAGGDPGRGENPFDVYPQITDFEPRGCFLSPVVAFDEDDIVSLFKAARLIKYAGTPLDLPNEGIFVRPDNHPYSVLVQERIMRGRDYDNDHFAAIKGINLADGKEVYGLVYRSAPCGGRDA